MTNYFRVMLGRGSVYAAECFAAGVVGANFGIAHDLSDNLPDNWREFNKHFIPIWSVAHPGKSKIAAGLSCGFLWTISKGIKTGDIFLSPDGTGVYRVGEVVGDYAYVSGAHRPHQRSVQWRPQSIDKAAMSPALRGAVGAIGTVSNVTQYGEELQKLIDGSAPPEIVATDPTIEDPATFALERHLEDFLVQNWEQTDFGNAYAIFEDGGQKVGQQYPTDTGPIDNLAVLKEKKELLVVELKRGRASDVVVGQVLRYMGFVQGELAVDGQTVRGVIIALEDDPKLKWALSVVPSVDFYRYSVTFKLLKS